MSRLNTYLGPNTLESSQFFSTPFTSQDLFAAPPQVPTPENSGQVMVGADDSALPALAKPGYGFSAPRTGSDRRRFKRPTDMQGNAIRSSYLLAGLVAVVALALYPLR